MKWRFSDFELDAGRRELRLRGREIVLQPRVLDVLLYLVRHRDRVVSKDELLERVWTDSVVTDASLQRAVSLARSALREGNVDDAIRSFPRRGYRFRAEVEEAGDPDPSDAAARAREAPPALAAARRAFGSAAWDDALARFAEADRKEGLAGADLERWAQGFLNLGRPAEAVPPLERAVAAHSAAGDRRGAGRAAVLLCQVHLEGRRNTVAKGWHRRAARLLEDAAPSREVALLEWMAGRIAIAEGDHDEAVARLGRALELARESGDLDAESVALIYLGHAHIARGEVQRGLALQDEAGAAVLGGEVTPWYAGLVYCGLIYVCQNRGDWSRAVQWTDDFARWSDRCPTSTYPAVCRLHRAEVLTVRGELAVAEQEVARTREELVESAPWAAGDASRLLGDVRLARGDLEGAERAYRRAHADGWDPCPGWAFLRQEQGDAAAARRALERALEDPSWPCRQRRRFLLAALARVAAESGDLDRAREAIAEFEEADDEDITPGQHGAIERARGELALAEGRTEEAVRTLRGAIGFWQDLDCPLEIAPLRLRLAGIFRNAGEPKAAELELDAAEAIWREAGAESRVETCRALRA